MNKTLKPFKGQKCAASFDCLKLPTQFNFCCRSPTRRHVKKEHHIASCIMLFPNEVPMYRPFRASLHTNVRTIMRADWGGGNTRDFDFSASEIFFFSHLLCCELLWILWDYNERRTFIPINSCRCGEFKIQIYICGKCSLKTLNT